MPKPIAEQCADRGIAVPVGKTADEIRAMGLDVPAGAAGYAAKITREIAKHLAEIARSLETAKHPPETVAQFLMSCIFTMFAEGIGLLPARTFADSLKGRWIAKPQTFPTEVEHLWSTMDNGGQFGMVAKLLKLLKFNGELLRDVKALPLTRAHLEDLSAAAECGWADVEPAIFGTLLERALDPKERHRLGAHYTPRAYVERLVRPTIEEPLRAEWDCVRAEVRKLVGDDYAEKTVVGKTGEKLRDARKLVQDYHRALCTVRVLDPACGTGNFLYVSMELMKRIESEVLAALTRLGEQADALILEGATVTPAQFFGIEKKPWAKEIAELVLWIGYLQWHARTRRNPDGSVAWLEPVLKDLHNIECRDAVLVWDREEPLGGPDGKPLMRWDGETYKKHPVTGEDVPDETARTPVMQLVNSRRAEWPKADFIVGNPPFLGGWKMRQVLGEGYVEALRRAHDDVPDSCDLVMYWWNHAAKLVRDGAVRRAGLVTTTTISQVQSRRLSQPFLAEEGGLSLVFAVDDHPWATDRYGSAGESAEVRVAMTTLAPGRLLGVVGKVTREFMDDKDELVVELEHQQGRINADLRIGPDVSGAVALRANETLCSPGVKLHGAGFIVTPDEARSLGLGTVPGLEQHIRVYRNGKDITSIPRGVMVIDLFGLEEQEVSARYPAVYQHVLERVKPERMHNQREVRRKNWWLFGETVPLLRKALAPLARYIVTPETARRRYFVFLSREILPDNAVIVTALDDMVHLGVLSSRAHTVWALAAGGGLGVRHEPRYNKTRCFDPFPFPAATSAQCANIRARAEELNDHRKARQKAHPTLTMTTMYNVLEKVRAGTKLTEAEKTLHTEGQIGVLKKLHDELDAAVFSAYGWPTTLPDEEILVRVVALNAERAAEEDAEKIRWLRPEFQNPSGAKTPAQTIAKAPELLVRLPPRCSRFYPLAPVDLPMETGDVLSTEMVLAAIREYQARCWAEPLQTYGPGSYYRAHENPLDHEHDLGCLAFFVTGLSVEPDTHGVFSLGVRIRTAGPRGAELASKLPDHARALFAYTRDPDAPAGESVRIHRIDFRELG